jgi:hypothetical protein
VLLGQKVPNSGFNLLHFVVPAFVLSAALQLVIGRSAVVEFQILVA